MKKIIHLQGSSDYTLCGFGGEEINDKGIPQNIYTSEEYADVIAEKKKYNTNCRLCQIVVIKVLRQIRK